MYHRTGAVAPSRRGGPRRLNRGRPARGRARLRGSCRNRARRRNEPARQPDDGNDRPRRRARGRSCPRGQVLAVIDDAQPRAGLDPVLPPGWRLPRRRSRPPTPISTSLKSRCSAIRVFTRKSVSPQEIDEIRARFAAAEARRGAVRSGQSAAQAAVAQARIALEYTRIRAPFDGVVTAKFVEAGSLASPGMPILAVENPSRFRLEATIDESDIAHAHLGQIVDVTIEALGGATGYCWKGVADHAGGRCSKPDVHGKDRPAATGGPAFRSLWTSAIRTRAARRDDGARSGAGAARSTAGCVRRRKRPGGKPPFHHSRQTGRR